MAKECINCGRKLGLLSGEHFDGLLCDSCYNDFGGLSLINLETAKSFNEFYEYDVVTIINENHGTIDKQEMMRILSEHAKSGWKLHTIYSNELGKNALSILGLGVNSTASEDVLIFERRIPEID